MEVSHLEIQFAQSKIICITNLSSVGSASSDLNLADCLLKESLLSEHGPIFISLSINYFILCENSNQKKDLEN